MAHKEFPIVPSTLESIDEALFKYVNEELNIFATTGKGWKKTPVIWASAERAFQLKNEKELRDGSGTLILPLITVERASVVKDMSRKGPFWGNVPPMDDYRAGSVTIARKINQDKTSKFAAVNKYKNHKQINFPDEKPNKKIVYEIKSIPMPVYVTIVYNIVLRAEYQQQINEMMTPFITKPGGINYFTARTNDHFYEGFIRDMSVNTNMSNLGQDERKYETTLPIEMLGYLIGEDKNQETPKVVIRENQVDIKLPRERLFFGDDPTCDDKDAFCRE